MQPVWHSDRAVVRSTPVGARPQPICRVQWMLQKAVQASSTGAQADTTTATATAASADRTLTLPGKLTSQTAAGVQAQERGGEPEHAGDDVEADGLGEEGEGPGHGQLEPRVHGHQQALHQAALAAGEEGSALA